MFYYNLYVVVVVLGMELLSLSWGEVGAFGFAAFVLMLFVELVFDVILSC